MSDELAKPFTAEELDAEIEGGESSFRIVYRLWQQAFEAGDGNTEMRLSLRLGQVASILAELRYQRERIT
jgi:hypothetical protein